MKKKQILIWAIALMGLFMACDKEDTKTEISLDPKDAPILIAKETIHEVNDYYEEVQTIEYNYDDNNFITSTTHDQNIKTTDGEQIKNSGTVNYSYNEQGKMSAIIGSGDYKEKTIITYENNIQTTIKSYHNGEAYILRQKLIAMLDINGKVIKRQDSFYDDYNEVWEEWPDYQIMEWNDNNLVKAYGYFNESLNSSRRTFIPQRLKSPKLKATKDSILESSIDYEYLNSINPEAFSSLKSLPYQVAYTKNLLSKVTHMTIDSSYRSTSTFSYEFNEQGYPKSSVETIETKRRENTNNYTFSIDYEYIDAR